MSTTPSETSGHPLPYSFSEFPSGRRIPSDALADYTLQNRTVRGWMSQYKDYYQNHIDESRAFIKDTAAGLSGEALIIGLGNGIEIPLPELAEQFDSVTVIDLDAEATQHAVGQLSDPLQNKFHIIIDDLTGIVGQQTTSVATVGREQPTLEDFTREVTRMLDTSNPHPLISPHRYNFVCSSLVLTQLTSMINAYVNDVARKRYSGRKLVGPDLQSYFIALTRLSNQLQAIHIEQLASASAESAGVYLSDTFSQTYLARDPLTQEVYATTGRMDMVLEGELMPHVNNNFNIQETREWLWYQRPPDRAILIPSQGSAFWVKAFSLMPARKP